MIRGVLFGVVVTGTIASIASLARAACTTGAQCCTSQSVCGEVSCGQRGADCQCCKKPNDSIWKCCDGACSQCWGGGWGGLPVDP